MSCPLCKSERYFVVRKHDFAHLEKLWTKYFSYNPFTSFDTRQVLEKRRCVQCDLTFYSPSFFGDKDFYEKISDNTWYYEENKWEFDRAMELIAERRPGSLLEIGCGNGSFLEKVRHAVAHVEGIEINAKAIATCKARGLNVSATGLDQLGKKYDMIVSFEVFEHLNGIDFFLNHSLERLASGGCLLIAVPNPNGYFKEMDTVLLDLPPHHNLGFSRKTFDFIAAKHDLEVTNYDEEPLRYVHYQGYMKAVIDYNRSLYGETWKNKILHKLRSFIFGLYSPLFFTKDRREIIGQTHMVLFRKK